MATKLPTKNSRQFGSTPQTKDAGSGNPTCEYCGRVVFPGEQQKLDRGPLVWHSAHCFRCFGCHREFLQGRTCHLLPTIALCDDCYPRRGFHVEEREVFKKGRDPNAQARVCFTSPVTKSVSPTNDSPPNIRDPGSEHVARHENLLQYAPRKLPLGDVGTPRRDRDPRAELSTKDSRSFSTPSRSAASAETLSEKPRKRTANEQFTTDRNTAKDFLNVSTSSSSAALAEASSKKPQEPTAAEQPSTEANSAIIGQAHTEHKVEALIADAMKSRWSPRVLISPVAKNVSAEAAVGEKIKDRTKVLEEMLVDGKFAVIAVNDWADVASALSADSEYVKMGAIIDGGRNSAPPGPSTTTQSEETAPINESMWRQSRGALRRTSSCSEIYPPPTATYALRSIHDISSESSGSDVLGSRGFFEECDEEGEPENVREADIRGSPSPVQSSTPIPRNAFACGDRPPSSFREDRDYESRNHSHSRTMSPEEVFFGRGHCEEEKSFQELRAIFEKPREGERGKNCCVCLSEVLPMERFECLRKVYHLRCFRCSTCKAPLNSQTFRDDGRQPYCKICFLDLKVSKNRFPNDAVQRTRVNSM